MSDRAKEKRNPAIAFRFPPEVDNAIRLAAESRQQSLTDFVIEACLERASGHVEAKAMQAARAAWYNTGATRYRRGV